MCTRPVTVWLPRYNDEDGKRNLLFREPKANFPIPTDEIQLGCGKCRDCHTLRATKQAMQFYAELTTTKKSSWFFTLTYDDDNLPLDGSVNLRHAQLFLKSLRNDLKKSGITDKFRYHLRIEYGGKFGRVHIHIIIFNYEIPDLQVVYQDEDREGFITRQEFESKFITKTWGKGNVRFNRLDYGTCFYIALHHMDDKKNLNQKPHLQPYIHPVTGEIIPERTKEISTFSARPALGTEFFRRWPDDLVTGIHADGRALPNSSRHKKLIKEHMPEIYEAMTEQSKQCAKQRTRAENERRERYLDATYESKKNYNPD